MRKSAEKIMFILVAMAVMLMPLNYSHAAADIQPYAVNTVMASKTVSGKTITGIGYASFSTTEKSASITISIQQKRNGTWYSYKSSPAKSASNVSSLSHQVSFSVDAGYEYRVKVVGTSTTTITNYSSSVSI